MPCVCAPTATYQRRRSANTVPLPGRSRRTGATSCVVIVAALLTVDRRNVVATSAMSLVCEGLLLLAAGEPCHWWFPNFLAIAVCGSFAWYAVDRQDTRLLEAARLGRHFSPVVAQTNRGVVGLPALAIASRPLEWRHRTHRCVTMHRMDTTVRNVDEPAFRQLKARAALSGKTLGQALSEAIRCYLGRPGGEVRHGTLQDLTPEDYPKGNERLSEEIDRILYGA